MGKLKNFPSYYLEIIAFTLMGSNAQEGNKLFLYFYPPREEKVSAEDQVARWQIVHEAANEVGLEDVQKVIIKIIKAYKAVDNGRALSPEVTYQVVTEHLANVRQSQKETAIFNAFVQEVIKKVN